MTFKVWLSVLFAGLVSFAAKSQNLEQIPDSQWITAADVIHFQPFIEIAGEANLKTKSGKAHALLLNLNKYVNSWYLLEVDYSTGWSKKSVTINIDNPNANDIRLGLSPDGQLLIGKKACNILGNAIEDGAAYRALGRDPYMPLCDGQVFVRNQENGHKDAIAWTTTFLRDNFGSAGDWVVNKVKEEHYDNAYFDAGEETSASNDETVQGAPAAAQVSQKVGIRGHGIDFDLATSDPSKLTVGEWYPAQNYSGVFLSVMKPKYVAQDILNSYPDRVNPLDAAGSQKSSGRGESNSIVVSLAMDLSQYRFGWNNGTEHPGVGWSPRAGNVTRTPEAGPDGFDTLSPLTMPGVVEPESLNGLVGTFTGGFQRRHSAFKWGPLSKINKASHYGFMEKGVLMSTLVPNLATFIVYRDGHIDIKTWTKADDKDLSSIKDARQNGVPLIERGPDGKGIPGRFVKAWGWGNWSGSAAAHLMTPRTAACIAENAGKRFLIISYFTAHTPSAMARVLQSYGCEYAIHLDMNSPQFAYTAFFHQKPDGSFRIEHLHKSMGDHDVEANGERAPRSILTPTYKDFFYVIRK